MALGACIALLRTWRRPTTEALWIALALVMPIAGRFTADSELARHHHRPLRHLRHHRAEPGPGQTPPRLLPRRDDFPRHRRRRLRGETERRRKKPSSPSAERSCSSSPSPSPARSAAARTASSSPRSNSPHSTTPSKSAPPSRCNPPRHLLPPNRNRPAAASSAEPARVATTEAEISLVARVRKLFHVPHCVCTRLHHHHILCFPPAHPTFPQSSDSAPLTPFFIRFSPPLHLGKRTKKLMKIRSLIRDDFQYDNSW